MNNITQQFLDELSKSKMTYKDIAEKSGVGKTTINSWVNNGVMPSLENAQKVLDVMGLELLIFDKIYGE